MAQQNMLKNANCTRLFHFMEKPLSLQANVQMSMAKEKVKIDNPFVTTGYAGAEYFCHARRDFRLSAKC